MLATIEYPQERSPLQHCMCVASEKQGKGQAESAESPNPKWYYLNVKVTQVTHTIGIYRESLH